MPLTGLKDEKGKCITWGQVSKGMGDFSDPVPVLMALYGERTQYCDFSATELINDPLQVQLTRRYDYFESVDELMDRTIGSGYHALMEKGFEKLHESVKYISEEQHTLMISIEIDGEDFDVVIGGTSDLEDPVNKVLWDYKTLTVSKLKYIAMGKADTESWKKQTNIYRWLIKENTGRTIKEIMIRAVVKDWRFYEFRNKGLDYEAYPRGCIIPIKCTPLKKVEEFVFERATIHKEAELLDDENLGALPECDTWGGIRCNHYCAVSEVCPYHLAGKMKKAKRKTPAKKKKGKK